MARASTLSAGCRKKSCDGSPTRAFSHGESSAWTLNLKRTSKRGYRADLFTLRAARSMTSEDHAVRVLACHPFWLVISDTSRILATLELSLARTFSFASNSPIYPSLNTPLRRMVSELNFPSSRPPLVLLLSQMGMGTPWTRTFLRYSDANIRSTPIIFSDDFVTSLPPTPASISCTRHPRTLTGYGGSLNCSPCRWQPFSAVAHR